MFTYDLHAIFIKKQKYKRESITTDSFVEAVSELFRNNAECINEVFGIYCRKPKSGDLALMAHFDGKTYRYNGTTQKKYF